MALEAREIVEGFVLGKYQFILVDFELRFYFFGWPPFLIFGKDFVTNSWLSLRTFSIICYMESSIEAMSKDSK